MACHSPNQSARPNWSPYFFWQGIYGSEDDHVFRMEETDFFDRYGGASEGMEYLKHQEFIQKHKVQRYAFLGKGVIEHFGPNRPNAYFTDVLSKLNFQRIARVIRNTPELYRLKDVFLQLNTCKMTNVIGGSVNYTELWKEFMKVRLNQSLNKVDTYKIKRAKKIHGTFASKQLLSMEDDLLEYEYYSQDPRSHQLAISFLVIQKLFNLNDFYKGWSTAFSPGYEYLGFATGANVQATFVNAFIYIIFNIILKIIR